MESGYECNLLPGENPQEHDNDDSSAVSAILCAEDEHQVLGAPRDASIDSLRCRFVATATRVHPGANHSDGAELAFKRAAVAWQKLKAESLASTGVDPLMERECDVLQDASAAGAAGLPLDEALDAFAVAFSECAAGSVGEDIVTFAGILGHAQRLVEEQEQYHSGGTTKQLKAVAAGLAFSAGCWAAGAVAVANGCGGVGVLAQRAAVMQGVGQVAAGVATACQHPATVKAVRAAGKKCQGPACPSREAALSLLSALPASCIPQSNRSREDQRLGDSGNSTVQPNDVLPVGAEVTVVGLRVKQELNGRHGVVVGAGEQEGRYQVRVFPERVCDGYQLKLIKRENLQHRMNQPQQCPGTINQFF